MRCILVILDGLGDRGCDALGGRTPLQAADTPNLDRLASLGSNGLYHACLQGMALPSEIAHFLLFGYDMAEFPGRGVLEALGYGVEISEDQVAVLAHFCQVKEEGGNLVLVVERADEVGCAGGALGIVKGRELMLLVLNFLDRAKLVGLRDSPADHPYYPAPSRPLGVGGD